MVLDSQLARGGQRSRQMLSKRGRRFRPLPFVLVAAVAVLAWYLVSRDSGATPPPAPPADAPTPVVQTPSPPTPPTPPVVDQREPEPEPEPTPVASPTPEPEPADDPPQPQPEPTPLNTLLEQLEKTNDPVKARRMLSEMLTHANQFDDPRRGRIKARQILTNINLDLIYSRKVFPNDPLTEQYTIKRGDALVKIARRYKTTPQLLQWINGIKSPDRIVAGKALKVIKGPFHAAVYKSDFRMDFYLADPADGAMLYINSVRVGLGEDDSTPEGRFIVRPGAKVTNPQWTDPRNGKVWAPDNPENPIGEYWIGLEGADEQTSDLVGYGIHGTIEPDSIGRQMSMGCIRLGDRDIALTFRLLAQGESTVTILR